MKIYTRTGDDGTTGLFGGARVQKEDPRVEAYGTVDETNAHLGLARASVVPPPMDELLGRIQADLFIMGAELACVSGKEKNLKMRLLDETDVARIEQTIDDAEAGMPPLTTFILPGGTPASAALHIARTVARRAERRVLELSRTEPVRKEIIVYLNRLSDLLFVLARRVNHEAFVADTPWP